MSLGELNKEQKQYLVLGFLVTAILATLVVFVIRFSLSSISEAKAELADLSQRIEGAERLLGGRARAEEEFAQTSAALRSHLAKLPPGRNYYSWATEIIYAGARQAGLEIGSIDELKGYQAQEKASPAPEVALEAYSLRIVAQGGYENLRRFFGNMQAGQPMARITGLEVSVGPKPDRHVIELFVQWPLTPSEVVALWQSVEQQQQEVAADPPIDGNVAAPPEEPAAAAEPAPALPPAKRDFPADANPVANPDAPVADPVVPPQAAPAPAALPAPAAEPPPGAQSPPLDPGGRKLAALLVGKASGPDETLGSFLEGLMEEINESR